MKEPHVKSTVERRLNSTSGFPYHFCVIDICPSCGKGVAKMRTASFSFISLDLPVLLCFADVVWYAADHRSRSRGRAKVSQESEVSQDERQCMC